MSDTPLMQSPSQMLNRGSSELINTIVMVYENYKDVSKPGIEAKLGLRTTVEDAFTQVGLVLTKKEALDQSKTYVFIGVTPQKLEVEAEKIGLELPLAADSGGYTSFHPDKKHLFKESDFGVFSNNDVTRLVQTLIEADEDLGGAETSLALLEEEGVISKSYCLHDLNKKNALIAHWIKKPLVALPLEDLRQYFGEEIALYFAFVGFYTKWLLIASVVGLVATIITFSVDDHGWARTVYSVFIAIWGTLFLEFWKQHNRVLSWKWNMLDYEEEEIIRPSYKGEERMGVYSKGEFIALREDEIYGLSPPKPIKYAPPSQKRNRLVIGLSIVLMLCVVVVIATMSIFTFRVFVEQSDPGKNITGFASVLGGIMNAVTIIILNMLYRRVAIKMNDWENHRTQSSYNNNLLVKIFLFQFVNCYTSMYYIAFFKRTARLWGDQRLADTCGNDADDDKTKLSYGSGCPNVLFIQLLTILGTNIVVGQAQEVIIPWATARAKMWWARRQSHREEIDMPDYETEGELNPHEGTLDEYGEIVIQYGYIMLFAASIPIAPLLAALNNIVEVRTDAFKFLIAYNKPFYSGAGGIGGWYYILQVLSIVGVVTNCLLIIFCFPSIATVTNDSYSALWVVVSLEHLILVIKFLVSILIPDVPAAVRTVLAKQYYIQQQLLRKYEFNAGNERRSALLKSGAAEVAEDENKKKGRKPSLRNLFRGKGHKKSPDLD